MEYENREDPEAYRRAMEGFHKLVNGRGKKYNLAVWSHFSIFDDGWIKICQGYGKNSKMIVRVTNESDTRCYEVATRDLEHWIEQQEKKQETRQNELRRQEHYENYCGNEPEGRNRENNDISIHSVHTGTGVREKDADSRRRSAREYLDAVWSV